MCHRHRYSRYRDILPDHWGMDPAMVPAMDPIVRHNPYHTPRSGHRYHRRRRRDDRRHHNRRRSFRWDHKYRHHRIHRAHRYRGPCRQHLHLHRHFPGEYRTGEVDVGSAEIHREYHGTPEYALYFGYLHIGFDVFHIRLCPRWLRKEPTEG